MAAWADRELTAELKHSGSSWLEKIPGYRGYRDKESRRDEDRRVREALSTGYMALAQRSTLAQGSLARSGRLSEIGGVERLERSLRLFADRLRTASYGYGGLFSDRPIDSRTLDQLRQFDEGLSDGLDQLEPHVKRLETATLPPPELSTTLTEATALVDALHRRFDLRGQVIERGEPATGNAVSELFAAAPQAQPHVADDLHFGDAVSIAATDYAIEGRMEFHADKWAWRQYLLRDGEREAWLHVPPSTSEPMALLASTAAPDGDSPPSVSGVAYELSDSGDATAEVVGLRGREAARKLRYWRYQSSDRLLAFFSYDWGTERQGLAGRSLDPLEVTVFPRDARSSH